MRYISLLFSYIFAGLMYFRENIYVFIQLILDNSLSCYHKKCLGRPLSNPIKLRILSYRWIINEIFFEFFHLRIEKHYYFEIISEITHKIVNCILFIYCHSVSYKLVLEQINKLFKISLSKYRW